LPVGAHAEPSISRTAVARDDHADDLF